MPRGADDSLGHAASELPGMLGGVHSIDASPPYGTTMKVINPAVKMRSKRIYQNHLPIILSLFGGGTQQPPADGENGAGGRRQGVAGRLRPVVYML